MNRVLIIFTIVAIGIAVGCSQQNGTPATVVPEIAAATAPKATATDDQLLPTSQTVDGATLPAVKPWPGMPPFVPLDNPTFLAAHESEYFGDEELVLGLEFAGEVRAYPVRMLRYHHVVNDTAGGEPLLVTY